MSLTREEVIHIARLARLHLEEEEIERFRGQLSAILDHVAQLAQLDTTGIPPTTGAFSSPAGQRPDEARPGLDPEQLARNAPDWEDGQFRVPPVFD